jgi:signal transduction histidine kinase
VFLSGQDPVPIDRSLIVKDLIEKANQSKHSDPEFTQQLLKRTWSVIEELSSSSERSEFLIEGSKIYKQMKDLELSSVWLKEAIRLIDKKNNPDIYFEIVINQIDIERMRKNYVTALEMVDHLMDEIHTTQNPISLINVWNTKGNIYKNLKRFEEARDAFINAYNYSLKLGDRSRILRICVNLSLVSEKIPDLKTALEYALKGVDYFDEYSTPEEKGSLLEQVAEIYRHLGNIRESIRYTEMAMVHFEKIQFRRGLANGYTNLSIIYRRLSIHDRALEYALKAYRLWTEEGDAQGICSATNNIGLLYKRLNRNGEAMEYFQKCLEKAREDNVKTYIATALNNMADLLGVAQKYETAIAYSREAISIYEKTNNLSGLLGCYKNLGNFYFEEGNLADAEVYFHKLNDIASETKNRWYQAVGLLNLGKLYLELRELDVSGDFLLKALDVSVELADKDLELSIHSLLIELYEFQNDYKQANNHAIASIHLRESVYNEDIKSKITEVINFNNVEQKERRIELLESEKRINKLELERQRAELDVLNNGKTINALRLEKERYFRYLMLGLALPFCMLLLTLISRFQIIRKNQALLEYKNQQINQKNAQLEELNSSKDKLFSIIAHDLRSPISSLMSLVEILNKDFDKFSREEIQSYVKDMEGASQATFKLLENLLEWASLQIRKIDINPQSHPIKSLVDSVVSVLKPIADNKHIRMEINLPHDMQIYADGHMTSTVIRNLVNNAVKFTPENGQIEIYAQQKDGRAHIQIKDTGVGIHPEVLPKIFRVEGTRSTRGTNGEKGNGLGLILCRELIEKNNGTIQVESEIGKGTSFTITLPLSA